MFALLILLSQKQDISRNESYNLIKRCKCVEYFWWIVDELLCMIYLSPCVFFSWTWAIFFFFSSFFSTCLVDMWHTFFGYASFLFSWHSFFHAFWACGIPSLGIHLLFLFVQLISLMVTLERVMIELGVLFMSGWKCLLFVSGRVRDLDHESMKSL